METEFGDGTWIVGAQIEPGLYQAPGLVYVDGGGAVDGYWTRLSGFSGQAGDRIANHFGPGPFVVEIMVTDAGFESHNCGQWRKIS